MAEKTASAAEKKEEVSLSRRLLTPRTYISFLIAAVILVVLFLRLDIDLGEVWKSIRGANPFLYVLAFLLYYASFPVRAFRWRILLHNAGQGSAQGVPSLGGLVEILLLGFFANCALPAKLGDAYRAYLLQKNSRTSFPLSLGTILAERSVDMVILFALLVVAALVGLRQETGLVLTVVEVGFVLAAIIVLLLVALKRFSVPIERRLPSRLTPIYVNFKEGVLGSLRQFPLLTLLTMTVWFLETASLLFVVYSLGLSLSLPLILFTALANALLTAVPFTPGGLGLVEGGLVGLLTLAVARTDALSIALISRTITYWSLLAVGILLLLISKRK